MRHLGSLLLTLILAPAIWALSGIGVSKFAEAKAASAGFGIDLAVGLAAILGAGVCYAVLVLPRLSPLGPVLAGIGFLGLVVWRAADVAGFNRAIPADVLHVTGALRNPADGYAALLAVPLLAMLFSARRWRRHEHLPVEYAAPMTPAYPPNDPAPGYSPTMPNGYPPPYSSYSPTIGADDPTWPLPVDPETTRRY